jgi:hypothetical protein
MERVKMLVDTRMAEVDADQVKLHEKKNAALHAIRKYHSVYPSLPREAKVIHACNRRIRSTVRIID